MSEIKHTSGVWVIDRRDPDRLYVAQQYGDEPGGRICEVFINCLVREDGREANARLIAAAPELLEALYSIRRYGLDTLSGRADGGPDDREWQREAVNEMTKRARIAIEKATRSQS